MTARVCSIPGCDRPLWARSLCGMHYRRRLTHGDDFDRSPDKLSAVGSPRLPAGPLLAAIDLELARRQRGWNGWAKDHGIPVRYLYRWRDAGTVALDHVDLVCDALGVHPTELYGADYYQAAAA